MRRPLVTIHGQIKNKRKVYAYAYNLITELKLSRMYSKVIYIGFVTVLEDDMQGLCLGFSKGPSVCIQIARTSCGHRVDYDQMMITLAHEMVHAKQWFRGELGELQGEWLWKGRKAGGYKYENQPWEREATNREEQLYVDCFL